MTQGGAGGVGLGEALGTQVDRVEAHEDGFAPGAFEGQRRPAAGLVGDGGEAGQVGGAFTDQEGLIGAGPDAQGAVEEAVWLGEAAEFPG